VGGLRLDLEAAPDRGSLGPVDARRTRQLAFAADANCEGFGNHPRIATVVPTVRASLVIATMAAIGAAAAGCGSGTGGHDTRIAIRAVVRAGCSAGPITAGRPYPGSIVVTGAGKRTVVRIGGRDVARVAVDPGGHRAKAAWVAGGRLVAARVDGRPATVAPNGQVRFTAPTGAETDLRLVVALRRPECTSPDAAG
jgi:hypothetical protein